MSDGARRRLEEQPGAGPLGRHLWHDPRNREYPVREILGARPEPRRRTWWTRDVFDQQGSSCTMQAAAGVCFTSPFRLVLDRAVRAAYDTEEERHAGYLRAQGYDPWEGGEPTYRGSSTDAPFKLLRTEGFIWEWRWCFGITDVQDTLRSHGPVAVGTVWKEGMDRPKGTDAVVEDSGEVRGGHAYRLVHDDADDRQFLAVNSWSRSWGNRGRFRIPYAVMERLLGEDGEAVTVVL